MMSIPASIVALTCGLAALAWIFFGRSQRGRMQGGALGWLSVPFVVLSALYTWYSLADVPIDLRSFQARIGIITVAFSQAAVLFALSYIQRGPHAK